MFQEKVFYYDENGEVFKSPYSYKILPNILDIVDTYLGQKILKKITFVCPTKMPFLYATVCYIL